MAFKIIVFGTSVQHFPTDVVTGKHLVPIDVVSGYEVAIKIIVFGTSVQRFPTDVVAGKHLVPIDVVARLSECPL